MNHDTLERCWQASGDFCEFEDHLKRCSHTLPPLEHAAWREALAFLFNKTRPPVIESEATILTGCNVGAEAAPAYEAFCTGMAESPIRPKFGRGTVEGEMIYAMSPGSTPNKNCSILSPLDSTLATPPTCSRATERLAFAPVVPPPMPCERQMVSDPSFMSEVSDDQPAESRFVREEAFPTKHTLALSSSWNSSDFSAHKENFQQEGGKPRLLSPSGSITVKSLRDGSSAEAAVHHRQG